MPRRLLTGFALALLATASADASTIRVHYEVSLLGLTIGTASVTGTIDPASYRIEADARLSGLASVLSSSRSAATAAGALSGNRVLPAAYATTSANATTTRTIRMALDAGTVTGLEIVPPWDANVPRVPITDAHKQHVLDPLSAFLMTLPAGGAFGPAACGRTLPVFDGGVRIDLALAYAGTRHVTAKGFEGDAAVCTVRYIPVSGQRVESKSSKFMADNRNLEAWVVPLPGTRLAFPFRISVKTMVGTVVVEADELAVENASRAATP